MYFLNFTFFKNMTTRIKNSYYCLKLRKKALVLFLLFGTCLTIPLSDLRRTEKLEADAGAIRISD